MRFVLKHTKKAQLSLIEELHSYLDGAVLPFVVGRCPASPSLASATTLLALASPSSSMADEEQTEISKKHSLHSMKKLLRPYTPPSWAAGLNFIPKYRVPLARLPTPLEPFGQDSLGRFDNRRNQC